MKPELLSCDASIQTNRTRIILFVIAVSVSIIALAEANGDKFLYGGDVRYVYMHLFISAVVMIGLPLIHFLKTRDALEPINLFELTHPKSG